MPVIPTPEDTMAALYVSTHTHVDTDIHLTEINVSKGRKGRSIKPPGELTTPFVDAHFF